MEVQRLDTIRKHEQKEKERHVEQLKGKVCVYPLG